MPTLIDKQAVVIGAGMGGLASALALSDHFERVTVLDSDSLPPDGTPRRAIPQGRHVHVLLPGGFLALSNMLPDLGAELLRGGALLMRVDRDLRKEFPGSDPLPQRDLGFDFYAQSRPKLEAIIRQQVRARSNIELEEGVRVERLLAGDAGQRVEGVVCVDADNRIREVSAGLVIDASGRGKFTLGHLEAFGFALPDATRIGVGLGYSTAVFEVPADAPADWKGVFTFPNPPDSSCTGLLFPMEDNQWILTMAGIGDEAPPVDVDEFLSYARNLHTRTIFNAISGAKQVREIVRFGFQESIHRHFAELAEFPQGLLPIGDAICRFNPIYGQGMSVAAQEAEALERLLAERATESEPLDGLAPEYFAAVDRIIEAPWATSVLPDLIYPSTRGERPEDFDEQVKRMVAMNELTFEDAEVHKVTAEVRTLLKPLAALEEDWLTTRLDEYMARK
ncbi:MAG: NAD(P)/FAD-dependent oxidoreductase [Planctomycetota bacterium]|jgi:2-polyprenyl-6-methoxyphenol hydroxylase-like FAD-dependent oxidoreductase